MKIQTTIFLITHFSNIISYCFKINSPTPCNQNIIWNYSNLDLHFTSRWSRWTSLNLGSWPVLGMHLFVHFIVGELIMIPHQSCTLYKRQFTGHWGQMCLYNKDWTVRHRTPQQVMWARTSSMIDFIFHVCLRGPYYLILRYANKIIC